MELNSTEFQDIVKDINQRYLINLKGLNLNGKKRNLEVKQARKIALDIALEKYPICQSYVSAYKKWFSTNKRGEHLPNDFAIRAGHRICVSLARPLRGTKQENKEQLETSEIKQETAEKEKHYKSVYSLLESWIDENDFLPDDNILAHFSGIKENTIKRERSRLNENNYEFQKAEYGYIVTGRPSKEFPELAKKISNLSKRQAIELFEMLYNKAKE